MLVVAQPTARAQDPEALARVKDLNKKAVDAYENLDLEEARKSLMTALEICATEGLNRHALKATTHLNLGVVLVGGAKQRDAGTKQFKRALEIDPNIRVPKRLANPDITGAFNDAIREMSGMPPSAPEPPATTTTPSGPSTTTPPDTTTALKPAAPAAGTAIAHNPVTDARPNEELPIKASIEESLRFDRVVLAYRPEGASDFLARDMEPESGTEYVARIPEPATRGGSVAYYIEARGRGGQALARNGSPDEPHLITLAGGAGPAGVAQADSGERPGDDSGGLAGGRRFWLAMGIGAGGGYAKGTPEVNPNYLDGDTARELPFSGMAAAKLLHFVPEFGYFVSPKMMLSVQGRLQYTTGATEVHHPSCGGDPPGICKPATGAVAVLGRATWFLGSNPKLQPYVSVLAGGGYIRYLVDLSEAPIADSCGPTMGGPCTDTVAGAGLLAGPAAGVLYGLTPELFLTGGVNALFGVPKTAFNFDLNLGLGYRL
jgi:hypothetical protein